jgi:DNA-binding response OmpR family regulator
MKGGLKLLLIEDDAMVGRFLVRALEDEGHDAVWAKSGAEGLAAAAGVSLDLVLLDWMLPDMDGLQVCRELRTAAAELPILMLTARGETRDKVQGLGAGADDYLAKPFEFEELIARMKALTRRTRDNARLRLGELEIDRIAHRVTASGLVLNLTSREFGLLSAICAREGQAVARAELLAEVWEAGADPASNLVEVHVSRLREKMGELAWMIETVRGAGYRLRAFKDKSTKGS